MLKCSKKSSFPVRSRTRTSVVLWRVHSFLLAFDLPKKEPSPNKIIGIYTLVTGITIENHIFCEDSQISPMDFPISGGFPIGKTIPRIQGTPCCKDASRHTDAMSNWPGGPRAKRNLGRLEQPVSFHQNTMEISNGMNMVSNGSLYQRKIDGLQSEVYGL